MKKASASVYIQISAEENEIVCFGIKFAEFVKYLPHPINNLLLIKGDFLGNRYEFNFELLEGQEIVEKLAKANVRNFGDFCFVDYSSPNKIRELNDEQIAELLYLGHMYKPLQSPFFEPLNNKFAYLAHDDSWYCKLYCQNPYDFVTVLCKKIMADVSILNVCEPANSVKETILQLATEGIIFDFDKFSIKSGKLEARFYIIGSYLNMDEIQNSNPEIVDSAKKEYRLILSEAGWSIIGDEDRQDRGTVHSS